MGSMSTGSGEKTGLDVREVGAGDKVLVLARVPVRRVARWALDREFECEVR